MHQGHLDKYLSLSGWLWGGWVCCHLSRCSHSHIWWRQFQDRSLSGSTPLFLLLDFCLLQFLYLKLVERLRRKLSCTLLPARKKLRRQTNQNHMHKMLCISNLSFLSSLSTKHKSRIDRVILGLTETIKMSFNFDQCVATFRRYLHNYLDLHHVFIVIINTWFVLWM